PVTLYVKEGRSLLQSSFLNALIQSDDYRFAVLVVDECLPKDRADIWNILKPRSHRIRLITIDHGPDLSSDDKMRVETIKPVSQTEIISILRDYSIGENDARRWAEFCEGCPRVAHVLGDNLRLDQPDLLRPPGTVHVWERFITGHDDPDSEDV